MALIVWLEAKSQHFETLGFPHINRLIKKGKFKKCLIIKNAFDSIMFKIRG